jgi:hypothetical protein
MDSTFKSVLRVQVHLLRLRNFLQQILNNHPVIIASLTLRVFQRNKNILSCETANLGVISM